MLASYSEVGQGDAPRTDSNTGKTGKVYLTIFKVSTLLQYTQISFVGVIWNRRATVEVGRLEKAFVQQWNTVNRGNDSGGVFMSRFKW